MGQAQISRREAILLLSAVVFAWGLSWPTTKVMLAYLPPLWAVALRSAVGTLALLAILLAKGRLILPRRGDLPVVFNIALLHMTGFSALVAAGLQYVPTGRSVVLAYAMPLWVAIGARLFLREPITPRRAVGIALGLAGLALLFNPLAFDWRDSQALLGNGLVVLASWCWAASMVHIRAHRWISTPFELVFWEALVATIVLVVLAGTVEGAPHIPPSPRLALLLLYGGVFAIGLAYWALATVNRSLPAVTTSLGVLGVPVVGIAIAVLAFGERLTLPLAGALALILGGIAIGTTSARSKLRPAEVRPAGNAAST